MSTASNKGAPMNDVELDEILNHLESYSKESVLGYVHTNSVDHTAAKAAIQALFNQEKANLQAALEAELDSLTHYWRSMFREGYPGVTEADKREMFVKKDVLEAIAAVFNKGDSDG